MQRNKGNERRRRRRGRATNSTRSAQRNSTPIRETVFTALAVVTDESTRLYRPPKQVKAFVCVEIDLFQEAIGVSNPTPFNYRTLFVQNHRYLRL